MEKERKEERVKNEVVWINEKRVRMSRKFVPNVIDVKANFFFINIIDYKKALVCILIRMSIN